MRRFLGWLLAATLLALDLLLAVYLLRRPLFEHLLRGIAARELAAACGGEVEIGAIGGNWLRTIRIDGVQWRGREGDLVRAVRDLQIEAAISPWRLLQGDLGGLLGARVAAAGATVDLDGRPPGRAATASATDAPGAPFDPALLERLLPLGAELRIDDLDFGHAGERRRGPLSVALAPAGPRRRVLLAHDRVHTEWELRSRPAGPPRASGTLRLGEPGQLLACVGLPLTEPRAEGGRVYVAADVDFEPLRLAGAVAVTDLRRHGARLQDSAVALRCDEWTLTVPSARVDLDGVRLLGENVVLPSPLGKAPVGLRGAAGHLEVQVADLAPYRQLLPDRVAELLPLQGHLRGWLANGLLRIEECRLAAPGVTAQVSSGLLPLAADVPLRRRDLRLHFALDLSPVRPLRLEGLELLAAGRIHGTLTGSLEAPRANALVELGATSLGSATATSAVPHFAAEKLSAAIAFADGALQVTDLQVEGLHPGPAAPSGGGALRGSVQLTLPRGDAPLHVAADLRATATGAWIAAAGLEPALAQRVRPFAVTARGEASLPTAGPPTGQAALQVEGLIVDELPRAAIDAALVLAPGELRIERCLVRAPAALELQGTLPLAGTGELSLQLAAAEQDLAFWTSLLLPQPLPCRGSLAVTATGTLQAPVVALESEGSLADPAPLLRAWPHELLGPPAAGPARWQLRARHDETGIAVEQLAIRCERGSAAPWCVDAQGHLPWRWQQAAFQTLELAAEPLAVTIALDGDGAADGLQPWNFGARIQTDGREVRLGPLDLRVGTASLTGSGTLALGIEQLLRAEPDWTAAALAGSWRLAGVRLEQLPARLLHASAAEGALTGELGLAGTLAAPLPTLDLRLADAQLRLPGAPRLTGLAARVHADRQRVEIATESAELGAAPVQFTATLQSSDPQWADLQRIAVTGSLRGQQTLLVHTPNLKLRGDVDLQLDGTLAKMRLHGRTSVTTGRFAQRVTALPGFDAVRARGGVSDREGVALHLLDPPWGQRLEFDVGIATARDFQVRAHALDTDLRADLRLLGDAANARLVGTVAGSSGQLRLPGASMSLRSLLVTFTEEDPLHPQLRLQAEGRRHGYRVQLLATGPTTAPEVVLTSVPALPAGDLLVLVSTGMLPERLQSSGTRSQATLVGSYLAQELAAWYLGGETTEAGGETFFDRFSVESGREISANGLETVLVEFRLTDLLALQAERDVYEDYNGGIALRWRFR